MRLPPFSTLAAIILCVYTGIRAEEKEPLQLDWKVGKTFEAFTAPDGKKYEKAKITRMTAEHIHLMHSGGVARISIAELPEAYRNALDYNPNRIAAEKKVAALRAAEAAKPKTFPGLTPVDVYLHFEKRGFTMKRNFSDAQREWKLTMQDGQTEYSIEVYGPPDDDEVTAIRATVVDYLKRDVSSTAADMFSLLATIPYDGAQPEKAKGWVANKIRQSKAQTTNAGMNIWLHSGGSHMKMMRLSPQ